MARRGENLLKRTGKKLSVLVFETTKRSRIMKKRMRIGALRKALKADYKDLGFMVFDAVSQGRQATFMEEEDITALIDHISGVNREIERLREGIARIGRARKSFGLPGSLLSLDERAGEGGVEPGVDSDTVADAAKSEKRAQAGLTEGKKERAREALRQALREGGEKRKGLFGLGRALREGDSTESDAGGKKARRGLFGLGGRKRALTPAEESGQTAGTDDRPSEKADRSAPEASGESPARTRSKPEGAKRPLLKGRSKTGERDSRKKE